MSHLSGLGGRWSPILSLKWINLTECLQQLMPSVRAPHAITNSDKYSKLMPNHRLDGWVIHLLKTIVTVMLASICIRFLQPLNVISLLEGLSDHVFFFFFSKSYKPQFKTRLLQTSVSLMLTLSHLPFFVFHSRRCLNASLCCLKSR